MLLIIMTSILLYQIGTFTWTLMFCVKSKLDWNSLCFGNDGKLSDVARLVSFENKCRKCNDKERTFWKWLECLTSSIRPRRNTRWEPRSRGRDIDRLLASSLPVWDRELQKDEVLSNSKKSVRKNRWRYRRWVDLCSSNVEVSVAETKCKKI